MVATERSYTVMHVHASSRIKSAELPQKVHPTPPSKPVEPSESPGGHRMGQTGVVDDRRVRNAATAVAAICAYYFVLQWFWPAPLGVLVQGLVIGGLTALLG